MRPQSKNLFPKSERETEGREKEREKKEVPREMVLWIRALCKHKDLCKSQTWAPITENHQGKDRRLTVH